MLQEEFEHHQGTQQARVFGRGGADKGNMSTTKVLNGLRVRRGKGGIMSTIKVLKGLEGPNGRSGQSGDS